MQTQFRASKRFSLNFPMTQSMAYNLSCKSYNSQFSLGYVYYVTQDAIHEWPSNILNLQCLRGVLRVYRGRSNQIRIRSTFERLRGELRARIRRLVIDVGISLASYFR